ncbi:MAG TPA: hypothetical protein VFF13_04750 [archaeon]|nr:hypothetical protein [archaeon]
MKIELKRQIIHILLGIFYITLFIFLEQYTAILAIAIIFGIGSFFSYTHTRNGIPFLQKILDEVQREKEINIPGKAAMHFTLGILLSAIIFSQTDKIITIGAITALTFGDGFSTLIGKLVGKFKTFGGKTLEGTIGGVIAAWIALMIFFQLETALAAAIFAMIAEYLPGNDNYTIPLAAGLVLFLLV